MTRTLAAGWIEATGAPQPAAPLPAVDRWRCDPDGEQFQLQLQVVVPADDPNLRGHFPGLPMFPGVFIIEALCQGMALAFYDEQPQLRRIRSVRFLAPLLDGDRLELQAVVSPQPGSGWTVKATGSRLDGTVAARLRADFGTGTAR